MASLNDFRIIGYLGQDPEVRTTHGGAMVATLSVAVSERWKDGQGQDQESTEWVTCILWRKQAELAQKILRKGSQVYVQGKLKTRSWEDRGTGKKMHKAELQVERFMVLDRKDGEHGERETTRPAGGSSDGDSTEFPGGEDRTPTYSDDDLPF
jgi:single-strand DNA-binding protein